MASRRIAMTQAHLQPNETVAAASTQKSSSSSTEQFRYTVDNPFLTLEQRRFYEENGFLIIKKLVTAEDLERYRKRFVALCNKEVDAPPFMTVMRDLSNAKQRHLKGEQIINKIQHYEDDEVLFDYCKTPAVLDYVSAFVGPNVKSVHTMLINKPPHVGALGRHPLHQDLHYFPFRPADRIVCAWTAMEPINKANGCLVVLPGTHKGELLEHDYPEWGDDGGVNKMYHGVKGFDPKNVKEQVYAEMDPGDTIFFHPILIHGSGANRTDGYRKAISCHYGSANCFYIDVKGTSQEKIAEEVEDLAKKLYGTDSTITMNDVWKFKSRLVRGEAGTL